MWLLCGIVDLLLLPLIDWLIEVGLFGSFFFARDRFIDSSSHIVRSIDWSTCFVVKFRFWTMPSCSLWFQTRKRKVTATFRTPVLPVPKKKASARKAAASIASSAGDGGRDNASIRSLCAMLRVGEESIEKIVDSWVEVYKSDRLTGYLGMANFFIHAAGCQGKITFAMSNLDASDIVKQLSGKFDEVRIQFGIFGFSHEMSDGKSWRTDWLVFDCFIHLFQWLFDWSIDWLIWSMTE